MTLLAPLSAIVGAAVCVPALLGLYFLKLRRRPLRVSTTLLWEASGREVQVNVPLRMIRASWLLALHLAILSLFLVALGRPAVALRGAGAERVVIVIDRSASMSARDGPEGRTRLEEAKTRALAEVDRHGRSSGTTRFMVATLAAESRALTAFTSDRAAVKAAIRAVEPTDQPGRLRSAADLVRAATAEEADEASADRSALAVIFTDGAFADAREARFGNSRVRFEVVGAAGGGDNVGVVAISARRDYDDPARVRVFIRAANAGAAAVRVPVTVTLSGSVVDRRVLEIPGAAGEAGEGATPGEATMSAEFDSVGGGAVVVTLGREDALASDNAAGIVLDPPANPRLLLVIPSGEPGPVAGPGRVVGPSALVYDVLDEMPLRELRVLDAAAYETEATGGGCGADAIIFDRVAPAAAPPCPTLSLGAVIPTSGGVLSASAGGRSRALSWKREHPVMRDVSLDAVFIASSLALSVGGGGGSARGVRVEELASGAAGPLIVLVEDAGVRRLVVAFGAGDSTWPATFGFPIFLSNAVEHLTLSGDARAGRMFTTGEPVRIPWRRGGPLVLTGPRRVEIVSPASPDGAVVGPPLELAGMYRIGGTGSEPGMMLAINVCDGVESGLAVVPEPEVGGSVAWVAGLRGEGKREVWHWFVIAAVVLLAVEWVVSAAFLRA